MFYDKTSSLRIFVDGKEEVKVEANKLDIRCQSYIEMIIVQGLKGRMANG
ncbi:hypothetical protein [Sulfurospirillum barnesii]|nr:hypothetical protein [Sulfurospirillum barnesii]